MPHGYECDRCGTFVEQPKDEFTLSITNSNAAPEDVHIANPSLQSDEGIGVESYTLCDHCRSELINNIESWSG